MAKIKVTDKTSGMVFFPDGEEVKLVIEDGHWARGYYYKKKDGGWTLYREADRDELLDLIVQMSLALRQMEEAAGIAGNRVKLDGET